MRLASMRLLEESIPNQNSSDSTIPTTPPVSPPATATWPLKGPPTFPNTEIATDKNRQMIDAVNTLRDIRADHLAKMPLDQKLELMLKRTSDAERVAFKALNEVSSFSNRLDRAFKELAGMIERVAGGKSAKEPDPPGSSIFDDGQDPESIF